jgi:hypothetical protein
MWNDIPRIWALIEHLDTEERAELHALHVLGAIRAELRLRGVSAPRMDGALVRAVRILAQGASNDDANDDTEHTDASGINGPGAAMGIGEDPGASDGGAAGR